MNNAAWSTASWCRSLHDCDLFIGYWWRHLFDENIIKVAFTTRMKTLTNLIIATQLYYIFQAPYQWRLNLSSFSITQSLWHNIGYTRVFYFLDYLVASYGTKTAGNTNQGQYSRKHPKARFRRRTFFMSRTKFEFGTTQIKLTKLRLLIQTSDLISRSTAVNNTVAWKLINIASGFQNIYLNQSRSKVEIPATKPGGKNGWAVPNFKITGVPNWFRRRTFHVLNSMN